ncbi:MAG TPA: pyruvate kinase [Chloroflexota bacterium]|nr:pyruvate kinase [Chloroflexota bacterium]HUM67424.1 pyruvate kinase [Chloroflexota bacterium]
MNTEIHTEKARQLIPAIQELRRRAVALEERHQAELQLVAADYRPSARNLLHYLALRQTDIRPLQRELIGLGLTSLGVTETAVLSTLDALLFNLYALTGETYTATTTAAPVTYQTGMLLLEQHTRELLGESSGKHRVRIMVTMPTEAATNPRLIRDLFAAGMDVMRINCAHDDPSAWQAMITHLRQAERELARPCKIYADLSGPKLRTGAIQPVGRMVRYRPKRNYRGEVTEMCRVWLTPATAPEPAPAKTNVTLPLDAELLYLAAVGDEIHLVDTRGRKRQLTIVHKLDNSCLAETDRTHYVETGLPVRLMRAGELLVMGQIGNLPELVLPIPLQTGDRLILTRADRPGKAAQYDEAGHLVQPAHIACTLKEAFDAVEPGHRVLFDDGRIHGRVLENDRDNIIIEITHTGLSAGRLQAEKGINFPDTILTMPSLTAKDLQDLEFMAGHADIIGLSFARSPEDVYALEEQLERLKAHHIGVVLKIETRQAFENLPRLLLAAMHSPPDGIMVARGDLAAELGFERMAEVQEEILWFCEAAHIPVIWATQVLENLAKRGAPSRAEVTDVVMSSRAECVMLNKGPFIVNTVHFLNDVLERMAAHSSKRRIMLRRLSISQVD